MNDTNRLLVVEDELTNSLLLKRLLVKSGYNVSVAHNGIEALSLLEKEEYDAVLSDWMMPQMDGIELIRRMRDKMTDLPLIIMITALVSEGARNYAIESGADDYIAKPIDVDDLLTRIKDGLSKKSQPMPSSKSSDVKKFAESVLPPFIGVTIATSTGGPPTLIELFKNLDNINSAAFYIVQHGPPWMLETFAQRLQKETSLQIHLGINVEDSQPGHVYIAPGDKHMKVQPKTFKIILDDGPKENFVRPSADPLFKSVSEAFGKYSIGLVLTGLGRDSVKGASALVANNGSLLVQNPDTAVAPSMPRSIIDAGINHQLVNIGDMPKTLIGLISNLNANLKRNRLSD